MRDRPSNDRPLNPRFLAIARDPRIVPGLHHACDEWCDYCPLTDRCLLFQCRREFRRQRRRPASSPAYRTAAEAMQFARDFASIDRPPPDRWTAHTPSERPLNPVSRNAVAFLPVSRNASAAFLPVSRNASAAFLTDDDSLAGIALEYARRSCEFVKSAPSSTRRPARGEPPPAEAIMQFHSRIYFKTTRALVGYRLAVSGVADRSADANTCARQTLACVDRLRAALAQFPDGDERRALVSLLEAIALGIEARFPGSRAFLLARLLECPSEIGTGRSVVATRSSRSNARCE